MKQWSVPTATLKTFLSELWVLSKTKVMVWSTPLQTGTAPRHLFLPWRHLEALCFGQRHHFKKKLKVVRKNLLLKPYLKENSRSTAQVASLHRNMLKMCHMQIWYFKMGTTGWKWLMNVWLQTRKHVFNSVVTCRWKGMDWVLLGDEPIRFICKNEFQTTVVENMHERANTKWHPWFKVRMMWLETSSEGFMIVILWCWDLLTKRSDMDFIKGNSASI